MWVSANANRVWCGFLQVQIVEHVVGFIKYKQYDVDFYRYKQWSMMWVSSYNYMQTVEYDVGFSAYTTAGTVMQSPCSPGCMTSCPAKWRPSPGMSLAPRCWTVLIHGLWTSMPPGVGTARSSSPSLKKWLRWGGEVICVCVCVCV